MKESSAKEKDNEKEFYHKKNEFKPFYSSGNDHSRLEKERENELNYYKKVNAELENKLEVFKTSQLRYNHFEKDFHPDNYKYNYDYSKDNQLQGSDFSIDNYKRSKEFNQKIIKEDKKENLDEKASDNQISQHSLNFNYFDNKNSNTFKQPKFEANKNIKNEINYQNYESSEPYFNKPQTQNTFQNNKFNENTFDQYMNSRYGNQNDIKNEIDNTIGPSAKLVSTNKNFNSTGGGSNYNTSQKYFFNKS